MYAQYRLTDTNFYFSTWLDLSSLWALFVTQIKIQIDPPYQ